MPKQETTTEERMEAPPSSQQSVTTRRQNGDERQLVIFRLAEEIYGVDINAVREIIRMQDVTQVPNGPEFIEGVINLRGKICPVMDLRKRFGVTVGDRTAETRIVVVEISNNDIGVIVDAVTEVLRVSTGQIAPPAGLTSADNHLVEGIVNLDDRLIILVSLDDLLAEDALGLAKTVAAAA